MQETIKLKNPIDVDGRKMAELPYDTEAITVAQFAAAEEHAKRSAGGTFSVAETDYSFQFYLGAYAVIAADPRLDITDIERVRGADIMKLMGVGRFFTAQLDESEESSSDGPSETTPDPSRQA